MKHIDLALMTGLVVSACAVEMPRGSGDTGATEQSVSERNNLSYNRLVYNRLVYNRLADNRLVYNRLSENRLVYNSLDDLEATEEGRELLFYVARCALHDGDTLVASHDGEEYNFDGLLGLAPGWEHGPLSEHKRRMVSACLIAHVNALGQSVLISLRAEDVIAVTPDELATYPVYEATFFGEVFDDPLKTYACLGSNREIAEALSSDRDERVCADATSMCEIDALGSCRDVCEIYSPQHGWTGCWGEGSLYEETISTFLVADQRSWCRDKQGGNSRKVTCDAQASIIDCSGEEKCKVRCRDGSHCSVDAMRAEDAIVRVDDDSIAEINCRSAERCRVACQGSNSRCEIDCHNAEDCAEGVRCKAGAECLLQCTGAESCNFERCDGVQQECSNGVIVCNQDCPSVT